MSRADADGQTDGSALQEIYENAELDYLEERDSRVIKDAIERLYYSDNYCVQGAVYPNASVRANLQRLDITIAESALGRYRRNGEKIRNSSAYVTKVLFNTIMESQSDLIVDPYLNFLSRKSAVLAVAGGG